MSEREVPTKLLQKIAFYGYAQGEPGEPLYETVFEAAAFLAEKGFTIINGGGPGLMAAATRGAESVDGETLTVTFEPKYAVGFEEKYAGNHPDVEIKTSNYIERIFTLMAEADCYVMFNGGTGTLSEFGLAWVMAKLYKGHHKPFILFGDFWEPIISSIEEHMLIRPGSREVFEIVNNKEDMLAAIERFDAEHAAVDHVPHAPSEEDAFMT